MIGLRLALGGIAVMAVLTAGVGGLAVLDYKFPSAEPSIVLLAGDHSPYWQTFVVGAQAAADERGVELSVLWPPRHESRYGSLYVIGCPELSATCGDFADETERLFHVGEASFGAGRHCADVAASLAPDGGAILILVEEVPNGLQAGRLRGFEHEMQCRMNAAGASAAPANKIIVEQLSGGGNLLSRQQGIAAAIDSCSPSVVVDLTQGSAAQLAEAAADLNRSPQLVSFDQSVAALELAELGEIAAIVAHDPYLGGHMAVESLVKLYEESPLARPAAGKGNVFVPPVVIRSSEAAEFRASLKQAAASL